MVLFINSISFSEIILILLFVLIFFGAKSIPGMARGLGKGIRQIKDATQDIQDEIRKTTTEIKRDVNINRALHEAKNTIESPVKEFAEDLKKSSIEVSKGIEEDETEVKTMPSQNIDKEENIESEDFNIKPDQQNIS